MLNSKFLMANSRPVFTFSYEITVGREISNDDILNITSYGFSSLNNFGNLSPKTFLDKSIKSLLSSCSMGEENLYSLEFNVDIQAVDNKNYVNSILKIRRSDKGKVATLKFVKGEKEGEETAGFWRKEGVDAFHFFTDEDNGKIIPIVIEYTPPHKLIHLLIQTIQNRLRSLRELCAGFCVLTMSEAVC